MVESYTNCKGKDIKFLSIQADFNKKWIMILLKEKISVLTFDELQEFLF